MTWKELDKDTQDKLAKVLVDRASLIQPYWAPEQIKGALNNMIREASVNGINETEIDWCRWTGDVNLSLLKNYVV